MVKFLSITCMSKESTHAMAVQVPQVCKQRMRIFSVLCLFLALFVLLPQKANAQSFYDKIKAMFENTRNLTGNTSWDQANGRLKIRLVVMDDMGNGENHYLKSADLYFNGNRISTFGLSSNHISLDGLRRNVYAYKATNDNVLVACREHWPSDFSRATLAGYTLWSAWYNWPMFSSSYYYTVPAENSDDNDFGGAGSGNHYNFITFYYYPSLEFDAAVSGNTRNITAELRSPTIAAEYGWSHTYPNVSKSLSISAPFTIAAPSVDIDSYGRIVITASASAIARDRRLYFNDSEISSEYSGTGSSFNTTISTFNRTHYLGGTFKIRAGQNVSTSTYNNYYTYYSGLYVFREFAAPKIAVFNSALTAENQGDATIKLSWTTQNPATATNELNKAFKIYKSLNNGATWSNVATVSYNNGTTAYNYTYTIPTEEREQGLQNYRFKIVRADIENATNELFFRQTSLGVQTNYAQPTNLLFDQPTKRIYFKVEPGLMPNNHAYEVTKAINSGAPATLSVSLTSVPRNESYFSEGFKFWFQSGIGDCEPSTYTVQSKAGTSTVGNAATLSYTYQPAGNRKVQEFKTSKGYYNNKVDMSWKIPAGYRDFSAFTVKRLAVGAPSGTTPTLSYNNVAYDNSGAITFSDVNVTPGTFYRYELFGIVECAGVSQEMLMAEDYGYAQAFGSVSGKVTFVNSTQGVQGVDIIFENNNPQDNSGVNRSLDLKTTGQFSAPAAYAGTGMEQFALQMWTKRRNAGALQQLFTGVDRQIVTTSLQDTLPVIGSTVLFGTNPETNEPMQWTTLSTANNKLLLVATNNVATKRFNNTLTNSPWSSSHLRNWLNNYSNIPSDWDNAFLTRFNENEQDAILVTSLTASPNGGTNGGSNTTDKIFPLSISEAQQYIQYLFDTILTPRTVQVRDTVLNCNFESSAERAAWTINNGSCTNKWYIDNSSTVTNGAITGYKLHVNNGTAGQYTISSSEGVVVASRPVTSIGASSYTLEFDFRCAGESIWDYVKVFLVDASDTTVVSGTNVPTAERGYSTNVVTTNPLYSSYPYILNGYNGSTYNTAVRHITATLTAAQMGALGTQKKLVFLWRNDAGSGTMPPAAIDNVKITSAPYNVVVYDTTYAPNNFWLRSPGSASQQYAATVVNRVVNATGKQVNTDNIGVLPAMTLDLTKIIFRPASSLGGNGALLASIEETSVQTTVETPKFEMFIDAANRLNVKMFGQTAVFDSIIPANNYFHLTQSVSHVDGSYYMLTAYINGKAIGTKTFNNLGNSVEFNHLYVGSAETAKHFDGLIDELRVWGTIPTNEQIATNYNRYIPNNTSGLRAYYRFDEPEGVGDNCYDLSQNIDAGIFNENHGRKLGDAQRSTTESPSSRQLALKAVTDGSGNYNSDLILPYKSSGTQYKITPQLGVHQFNPQNEIRTLSATNTNFSSVNFTDESKFVYSGKVVYAGGNYPVEGCQFYIDNALQSDANTNQPIKTAEDGTFTLSVPVGTHTIKVMKQGHTFVAETITMNFQDDDNNPNIVRFEDNTKIRIVGRVVGGTIESAKNLGFGASNNNIGRSEIVLQAERGTAKFVEGTNDTIITHFDTTRKNKVTYGFDAQNNKAEIRIETNDSTGEFYAYVYPIKYTMTGIWNGSASNKLNYLDAGQAIDYTNKVTLVPEAQLYLTRERKDSIQPYPETNPTFWQHFTRTDSIAYNDTLVYTHRVNPTMTIVELDNSGRGKFLDEARTVPYYGEQQFTYYSPQTQITDTIQLVELVSGNARYTFVNSDGNTNPANPDGYPVYAQGTLYRYDVSVQEKYLNWQTSVASEVPVAGGEIRVKNEMAARTGEQVFILDSTGVYRYSESVVKANTSSGLRSIEFSYPCISAVCPTKKIEAIVKGGESTGVNFTTQGPDQILFVLRDPPGNNSYAYWETETTIENKRSYTIEQDFSLGAMAMAELGNKTQIMTLAGIGVVTGLATEFEATNNFGLGLYGKEAYNEEGEKVTTISIRQRVETSAEPDYVGPDADVFVGLSTNQLYGYVNALMFADTTNIADFETDLFKTRNGAYHIGKNQGINFGTSFGTTFFYTQKRIRDELIPEWQTFIASLVKVAPAPANIATPYYHSLVPANDANFGKIDYYELIYPVGWTNDDKLRYTDSVALFNQQIATWQHTLALNEGAKVRARQNNTDNFNYSFGDGVSVDYSAIRTEMEESSHSAGGGFTQKSQGNIGISIAGYGVQVTVDQELNFQRMVTSGGSSTNSETMGFVLATSDAENKLTVDIYDGNRLEEADEDHPDEISYDGNGIAYPVNTDSITGGFIFITRAGQTSCPYENEYVTEYYQPGTLLNTATMRNEVPELRVLTPATVSGVPADGQAVYQIQLLNNSESHVDRWFDLRVQSSSNPNGAVIRMDGAILTENGQPIYVPYGTTGVLKTITIERGPQAYNYENISLIMASQCQYNNMDYFEDIFSAAELSASFLQGCSDVTLTEPLGSWVMNTNSNPSDILTIKVSGFDQNFANLGWINVQYKESYSSQWTTLKRYYFNQAIMNADNSIDGANKVLYNGATMNGLITENWDLPDFDGNYEVRAVMVCVTNQGSTESPNYQIIAQTPTPARAGVRDMLRPEIFGRPEPRDGVLDIDDEILVTFNEPIIGSRISTTLGTPVTPNIRVQGILSEGTGANYHPAAVHLSGTDKITTQSDITLAAPFTVEGWIRPSAAITDEQILFSHGGFEIGLASSNMFVRTPNGGMVYSDAIPTNLEWSHVSVSYTITGNVYMYFAQGSSPIVTNTNPNNFVGAYNQNARVAIGNNENGDAGFAGDVHDFRIWTIDRSSTEISANTLSTYNGVETNLKHIWRLDEMEGTTVADLAGGLTADLNGAIWKLTNAGKAIAIPSGSAVKLPGDNFGFSPNNDYSVEFWFKGASGQTNATLFSAGNGAANTDMGGLNNAGYDPSDKISIYFNAQSRLAINTKGTTLATTSGNYLDGKWHHLAFSVNRLSNANLYVDGNLIYTTPAANVGGMAAPEIYLGQRAWYQGGTQAFTVDAPFAGQIDEVRIWKAALDAAHIKDFKNVRLGKQTLALAAYYPFEEYTVGAGNSIVITPTLSDFSDETAITATFNGTADYSTEYAPVKMEGAYQDLPFHHVVNGDKILVSLTSPRSRIEKSLVTISMQGIQDLNGNLMKDPLVWTALVNQTQLRWSQKTLELEGAPGSVISQTIQLVNSGGTTENYTITDVPTWLSISAADLTGSVPALSSKTITISVPTSINVGRYEQTLLLNGTSVDQLTVKANIHNAAPNDWSVNPADYEHNATIIAALLIDGAYSIDTDDKLAAFVGNECRGVANLTYDAARGRYSVYLTLYSDNFTNENFIFRIWDASRSETREAITNAELNIASGYSYGSITSPIVFEATNAKLNKIQLNAGWSWISINITKDDMTAQNIFGEVTDKMLVLKSKTNFSAPYNGEIQGEVGNISNIAMYKLRMREASMLHTAGMPVNPTTTSITLNPGWNWIAYTPQGNLSVQQALAGLQASSGDVIKDQTSFATYSNGSWQGSLATMQAGKGYVYQYVGATARTFTYPYVAPQDAPMTHSIAVKSDEPSIFTPVGANKYENNMNIIAIVKNGNEMLKNVEIGAFIGDECRGAVRSKENGMAFLTVAGANEGTINFKVYNHDNGETLSANQTLPYETDVIEGTIEDPYIINWTGVGIKGINEPGGISLYPNPTVDVLHINIPYSAKTTIEIVDVMGKSVKIEKLQPFEHGVTINVSHLSAGVYFVKIGGYVGKFIKK